ncbi:MAG: hypothetical protein U0K87_02540 [Ruminococcus sp.]|jgi:hypothetical protein|nr:hypothetical protein [Ruminococcus sp.]
MRKEYSEPEFDLKRICFEQILDGGATESQVEIEDPIQDVFD